GARRSLPPGALALRTERHQEARACSPRGKLRLPDEFRVRVSPGFFLPRSCGVSPAAPVFCNCGVLFSPAEACPGHCHHPPGPHHFLGHGMAYASLCTARLSVSSCLARGVEPFL